MKTLARNTDEARAVTMLRALANPVRYRIVQILARQQTCVTGDLVAELPVGQSTVSEHLAVLKEAGIVQGVIDGPSRCYCLNPESLRWLREQLNLDGCC